MKVDDEILKIISNETITSVNEMNIVTPSIYKSIFTKNASNHKIDMDDEERLTDSILDDKISTYQKIQENTNNNALQLSENTDKAITAIKEKDETKLSEILQETQALREEIQKLKEAVYKDELTHIYNRRWLHDNFLDSNDKLIKNGTLALIDLNYFKDINDKFGHVVGDKVLIFIAYQLSKIEHDVVRYGGDEFIIIFSDKFTKKQALESLKNVRETILQKKLKADNASFKMSFSIGLSEFTKDSSLAEIIDLADKEMYKDKNQIKKIITGI